MIFGPFGARMRLSGAYCLAGSHTAAGSPAFQGRGLL